MIWGYHYFWKHPYFHFPAYSVLQVKNGQRTLWFSPRARRHGWPAHKWIVIVTHWNRTSAEPLETQQFCFSKFAAVRSCKSWKLPSLSLTSLFFCSRARFQRPVQRTQAFSWSLHNAAVAPNNNAVLCCAQCFGCSPCWIQWHPCHLLWGHLRLFI